MHCRRTDFVNPNCNFHGPLSGEYYKNAIDIILTKVHKPIFILFGDDNKFWKSISDDIYKIYNYEWFVFPDENEIDTFILMQRFENFIMSNSTFNWWIVWLSKYKNVIIPKVFYGPQGVKNWEDIYESDWIRC